jgi:Domain of unknown function (DUF4331)
MSSHREAPEISKDPVADSTDLYAFVSPDRPDTVTIIANYIPLQLPSGGPNFFEFGDDVLYEIKVSNSGKAHADVTYQFRFHTVVSDPGTFLYNTGQITSLSSPNWNRKQFYSVTRVENGNSKVLAADLSCPPCNVGTHSIPNIATLDAEATHALPGGGFVFCGQRLDPFYVDLGSIFDLGDLRPFQGDFLIAGSAQPGVNALAGFNVHTIAIQVPITELTNGGARPSSAAASDATIGVWTTASRQKSTIIGSSGQSSTGPYVQVSRLGNPLINEVIIPMGEKDYWNTQAPSGDSQFAKYFANPGLAELLPVLYPPAFPNLKALNAAGTARADLEAILLTGLPAGVVAGFQNYTGSTQADMLRLNVAIAPSSKPNILGLIGGDAAGFPNGRRVFDDVTSIELRCVAGVTFALVDKKFTPDAAAGLLYDVVDPAMTTPSALEKIGVKFQSHFPYLAPGADGFTDPVSTGVLAKV